MTNVRQLFLKLVAFNLLLSLSLLTLDAQAQQRRRSGRTLEPIQDKIVLSHLNINVYGQQIIKVKKLVKQTYGPGLLQGKKLQEIVVRASAQSQQSRIVLLINGQRVSAVRRLSYFPEKMILTLPRGRNIIGQDINTIQLKVVGDVQLKRIVLKMRSGHAHGGKQILRAQNIRMSGYRGVPDQLSLEQILRNQGNRQKFVKEIRIVARAMGPRGSLAVRQQGFGKIGMIYLGSNGYSNNYPQQKTITVGGQTRLSDLKLIARGQIVIQSIEVVLNSRGF